MIRVLHLTGRPSDFQTSRALETLARDAGGDFQITRRAIGPGAEYRTLSSAFAGLRRGRDEFDVIHAWDERALTAAALAGGPPVVFTPGPFMRPREIAWLRAVMGHRDVQVVCPTTTQRRVLVERGIPIERCHVIRPGVDFARVRRRRDPALRAALGIADDDHVLLAAGESTRAAAHDHAVWAASIIHVVDDRQKILLWGRGERARRAAALGTKLAQPGLVKVAERALGRPVEFEELLPAADAVLVAARGPVATLPIAICMAAALPIIAGVTYTVAELLEDRHTALMAAAGVPRFLAQRVLDLRADPQLQWSIADMARTEAYDYFAQTRFLNQYRTAYRQIAAGEAVSVPEAGPGAGLRFHGRG